MHLPPLWTHKSQVLSLYRQTIRQARQLPHEYLVHFTLSRTRERFRSNRNLPPALVASRMKILARECRRLQMANEGDKTAISRVLDQAFGRRGRLRRQLTSHLTSNSPEKSISHVPNNPRLSPPLYSASVSTLLTSQLGRVAGKALSKAALNHPPNLPARANPSSDDARLMGRFSLRREANIRWRFFTDEVHKQLQPPLVVRDAERDKKDDGTTERDQPLIEKRKGTGSVGLEKVFIEMERVAAAASNTYQLSAVATTTPDTTSQYPLARDHSEFKTTVRRPFSRKTRYFRRHVAEILSRTPILVETPSNNRLSVTTSSFSRLGRRPPVATAPDIAWIEYANGSSVKRA